MVQPIDFNRPIYNGVNINIRKPEVNTDNKATNPIESNDNGIYNAVKINIDNPKVGANTHQIYDYPEAEGIVTYEMLNITPNTNTEEVKALSNETEKVKEEAEITEKAEVPAPNYTTVEDEKGSSEEKKTLDVSSKLSFKGAEESVKKPEIVPPEPILPKVDVSTIVENLENKDRDLQAKQIEEIVRTALTDKEMAKNYLISDIFSGLIKITEEDVTKLTPPTKEQIEARKKLIANIVAAERDKKTADKLPYQMSDDEIKLAMDLSSLELAERNKEYAITAISVLAELFVEDFQAKEGRVVPITDVPGVSAIVNALRKDPDPSVKLAAIDGLRHVGRAEYKEELSALFTLAQTDPNPGVSKAAKLSLDAINNI